MLKLCLCAAAVAAFASGALAQPAPPLPDYRPLPPEVLARAYPIDPAKGYFTQQLAPNLFVLTDGLYQSLFVRTGQGVVLFDAPLSLAAHILRAVAEVTSEPVVAVVYSHAHVDHIGGTGLILKQRPNIRIIAEQGTADFVRTMHDPDRPVPTQVFRDRETLRVGSMTADLQVGHWHSPSGDLFIYFPTAKVLMAVDAFSAGSVPFMGLDLTQNMDEYRKVFDQMLARDWDVMVPGHLNNPATRADVQLVKAYVNDAISTVTRIQRAGDPTLATAATQKYGQAHTYAIGGVLIDDVVDVCARELVSRWKDRLADVDVWAASHCRTALVYIQWDVGPHGRPD